MRVHYCFLLVVSMATMLGVSLASGANSSSIIRISLGKTTKPTGGELSQPITSYYVKTAVGSPPKPFKLMVDVNARETWLPHLLKLGLVYYRLNYNDGYAKKNSRTSVKETKVYKIDYNGCKLSGKAYTDFFEFKDVVGSLKVPSFKQRFLAMSSASNDKFGNRGDVDGVIAFGPYLITESYSFSVAWNLWYGRIIADLKIGLALEDNIYLDKKERNGGELTLGGVNDNYFLGNINYHKRMSDHQWDLKLDGVMLGSVSTAADERGIQSTAIISTSTNDIYAPQKSVKKILSLLGFDDELKKGFNSGKLYEIECLKATTAPPLTFVIESVNYTINPTSYIRKKLDGMIFKSETCYVGILANNQSENEWILGTSFLSNFYSVFDFARRKVGLVSRIRNEIRTG